MKFGLASLLATTGAALLTGTAVAHPGHASTDVAAQLAAPLAGADHFVMFVVMSLLAVLGAGRLAWLLIERRHRIMVRARRR